MTLATFEDRMQQLGAQKPEEEPFQPEGGELPPYVIRDRVRSLESVPDDIPKEFGVPPTSIYSKRDELQAQHDSLLQSKALGNKDPEVKSAWVDLQVYNKYLLPSIEKEYENKFRDWEESGKSYRDYKGSEAAERVGKMLPGSKLLPMRMIYDSILSQGRTGLSFLYRASGNTEAAEDLRESYNELQMAMSYEDQDSILGPVWAQRARGITRSLYGSTTIVGATGGLGGIGGAAAPLSVAKLSFPALVGHEAYTQYEESLGEALSSGMGDADAHSYAAGVGAVAGLITLAFGTIPGLGSASKSLSKMWGSPHGAEIKSLLRASLGEQGEEGLIATVNQIARTVSGIDPEGMTWEKFWPEVKEAMIQGGIAGGLADVVRSSLSGRAPDLASEIEELAERGYDILKTRVKAKLGKKFGKAGEDAVEDAAAGRRPTFETTEPSRSDFTAKTGRQPESAEYRRNYAAAYSEMAEMSAADLAAEEDPKGPVGKPVPQVPLDFVQKEAKGPDLAGLPSLQPLQMQDVGTALRTLGEGSVAQVMEMAKHILGAHRREVGVTKDKYKGIILNIGIEDERLALRVLAHEVGHLMDWVDSAKMTAEIPIAKVLGIGSKKNRTAFYADMRRRGIKSAEIKKEMVALSEWWSPYDKSIASKKYLEYRESSKELFAEFMSVFMVSPGDAQLRAPKTFALFNEFMQNRPKVAEEYVRLQQHLNGTPEEVGKWRIELEREMFQRAEQTVVRNAKAKMENESVLEVFMNRGLESAWKSTSFYGSFFDFFNPLTKHEPAIQKRYGDAKVVALEAMIDDFQRAGTPAMLWAHDYQRDFIDRLEQDGLSRSELEHYMSAVQAVAHPDDRFANPNYDTPATAMQRLRALKDSMGREDWDILEATQQAQLLAFHTGPLTAMYQSGFFGEKTYNSLLDRKFYAPTLIAKYLEGTPAAGIFARKGTFNDAVEPVNATVMKGSSMLIAAEYNNFKKTVADVLTEFGNESEFRPLKKKENPKAGEELFVVYRHDTNKKGEIVSKKSRYAVSPEISAMVNGPNIRPLAKLLSSAVYSVWYPLYITYQLSFMVNNVPRDLARSWWLGGAFVNEVKKVRAEQMRKTGATPEEIENATKPMRITMAQTVAGFLRNWKHGMDFAKGRYDNPVVRRALESRILQHPITSVDRHRWGNLSEQEQYNILTRAGVKIVDEGLVSKTAKAIEKIPAVGTIVKGIRAVTDAAEAASKLAGMELAERMGLSPAEIKQLVRNYWGTPNSRRRGDMGDWINGLSMFASVRLSNMRAHGSLAKNNRYWGAGAAMLGFQVLLDILAEEGYLGEEVKDWWDLIPEDEKNRKWIIPAPIAPLTGTDWDGERKAYYFKVAKEHDAAAATAMMRYAIAAIREQDPDAVNSMFDEIADQLIGTPSPIVDIPMRWREYLSGQEPMDSFFDTPIVNDKFLRHGGWPARRRMLAWTIGKMGVVGDPFKAFFDLHDDGASIEGLSRSGPWRSIIGITNRGIREDEYRLRKEARTKAEAPTIMLREGRAVHTLEREYLHLLDYSRKGGELTVEQKKRIGQLARYHKFIYEPQRQQLKEYLAEAEKARGTRMEATWRQKADALVREAHRLGEYYRDYFAAVNSGQSTKEIRKRMREGL